MLMQFRFLCTYHNVDLTPDYDEGEEGYPIIRHVRDDNKPPIWQLDPNEVFCPVSGNQTIDAFYECSNHWQLVPIRV